MPGTIVTIAQQKGGAGKTTLATHLALAWAGQANASPLIDIDPQAASRLGFGLRARTARRGGTPARLRRHLGLARRRRGRAPAPATTISSSSIRPPHAETEARLAIRAAKLVLVPVQPSPMDLWATKPTLDLAAPRRRGAAGAEPRAAARQSDAARCSRRSMRSTSAAEARIGNRVGLAAAINDGQGITRRRARRASAAEIEALARNICATARNGLVAALGEEFRIAEVGLGIDAAACLDAP